MKKLLVILILVLTNHLGAQDITGTWNGALDIQGMQLRVIFHIVKESGNLLTTMDSPDQGAKGIPTDKTSFENGELNIFARELGMAYTAKLKKEKHQFEGTFKQGGMTLPLILSREKVEKKVIARPQDPTKITYQQEEVTFINPKGGHKLAGMLTIPENGAFDKVMILISGSGPQNRNEELLNHRPFLVLSDHLTKNGMAVLRYDDRGVGESTGDFKSATSRDFADDVHAAVDYLKTRKDIKGKQIGLIGHSEGGMIAPMVASENEVINMIVLLAGPGISIKELMLLQTEKITASEGTPKTIRKINADILAQAFDYVKINATLNKEELKEGLHQILSDGYDQFSEDAKKEIGAKDAFLKDEARMMLSDWFLYFMRFEPTDFLEKVTCPVLAVNGEFDLQVTPKENLEGIRVSLAKANNQQVTIHEFKGLNHLFQTTTTGAPSEYGSIEETFNKEAMDFITNWILTQQ